MYTLFVVDDEPLTREYVKTNLAELHSEWLFAGEAGDGQEALDMLEDGRSVDLLVTDIKMPVMDGLELARNAAQRFPNLKIAILSGYDEFALVKEALRSGVHEYLLKPVVRTEFVGMLDKIAEVLKTERRKRLAYETMVSLSQTTKSQVVNHFLKAVVSDNNVEIKALYPLLFRMKVSLVEAEGAIMALEMDEGQLLRRDVSPNDLPMFHYILHQTTLELAEPETGVTPFFDSEQRTCLLITGDDETDLLDKCRALFSSIGEAMRKMTGLEVWGAVGSVESESLQLHVSYRKALALLKKRLFSPSGELFMHDEAEPPGPALKKLDKAIAGIRSALSDQHDPGFVSALRLYMELMEDSSTGKLFRFGAFLLNRLQKSQEDTALGGYEASLLRLKQLSGQFPAPDSPEAVATAYRHMLQPLAPARLTESGLAGDEEHDIVKKAKEYIIGHFAEPLSLALIAEIAGVSPGYLSNLFQQNDNESYIKFLTRVRMEHAAKLLRAKPAEKVYAISEKVGYVSVKHFSYVFKQYFGIPPGEYQEKV
ncbi:response regulator [Cohnella suwonensis]|uniref:Response regulator n=1 Tax=Cohnella suwonensis TaxID=696072 RepID=A0ABW0LVA5_9BACL